MAERIEPSLFHQLSENIPVIDVRSPSEYQTGHLPGSLNLPLLDDAQRAEVGTLYKKEGRESAIERGLEFIGPKMAEFVRFGRKHALDQHVLIYCWRGGMRSGSMAWLMETAGLTCQVLEGGYKAYRSFGKALFQSFPEVRILGGFTGSGKTKVLLALAEKGEQILDIEARARHRGSSFGAIGQESQKSNEQFENDLIADWLNLDPGKPVWIEDESRILGKNQIPEELFYRIRNSVVYKLDLSRELRADNLVEDYAGLEKDLLRDAIRRIERKLGGQNMKLCLEALEQNDFRKVALITLQYYDETYGFGLSRRDPSKVVPVISDRGDANHLADLILAVANQKPVIPFRT